MEENLGSDIGKFFLLTIKPLTLKNKPLKVKIGDESLHEKWHINVLGSANIYKFIEDMFQYFFTGTRVKIDCERNFTDTKSVMFFSYSILDIIVV